MKKDIKILVIDNYDSFTYNLVQMIERFGFGEHMDIFRNDKIGLDEVEKYDKILLSPGPGIPSEAGIMPELIKRYAPTKSILGVCLGEQAIGEAFGCKLLNMPTVLHGTTGEASVLVQDRFFKGIPQKIQIAHYHSWVVDRVSVTNEIEVTAIDENGLVAAIRHKKYDVRGVQFHPESVLTDHGYRMMANWLGVDTPDAFQQALIDKKNVYKIN